MPTNGSEAIRVKPSDPRHFEIDFLQIAIMEAVQAQIAKNSISLGFSKPKSAVLESGIDPTCVPDLELEVYLEELRQKQLTLLKQDPDKYEPSPGIMLLKAFLFPKLLESDASEDDAPAKENELELWEIELRNSPMGNFIESLNI